MLNVHILDNECVEVGELLNSWAGSTLKVLLLKDASLGVPVTENEVDLTV